VEQESKCESASPQKRTKVMVVKDWQKSRDLLYQNQFQEIQEKFGYIRIFVFGNRRD
jgi:hypothetical protein